MFHLGDLDGTGRHWRTGSGRTDSGRTDSGRPGSNTLRFPLGWDPLQPDSFVHGANSLQPEDTGQAGAVVAWEWLWHGSGCGISSGGGIGQCERQ